MTIKLVAIPSVKEVKLVCSNSYNDEEAVMVLKLTNDNLCYITPGLDNVISFIDTRFSKRALCCDMWMRTHLDDLRYKVNKCMDFLSKKSTDNKFDKFETLAVMQLIAELMSSVCVTPLGNNTEVTDLMFENLDKQFYIYNSYRQQYRNLIK